MKIRPLYLLILFLLLLAGVELFYAWVPLSYEKTVQVMGTTVRVKVVGPGAPRWTARAIDEIKRLERLFIQQPLQISAETIAILKLAGEVNRASRGAFDVYWKKRLDLGGIGKGYAVESARRLLLKKGVKRAIIDMHSSIAVIGNGWSVGVQDPRNREKILGVVVLNDGEALSTSAQYEQPGHIIDPRTGRPADKCLSATVIAKDAALADALSTAVFVLGPAEGLKLLGRYKAKAIIVDRNGTIHDNLGIKLR